MLLRLFAVVLLLACGPSRRRWEPRAVADVSAPSSYAIVAVGTPLSIEPRGQPRWIARRLTVFRVIDRREGVAELETTAARHCAPGFLGVRLRFYADERALVPVTQREVVQSFPDGTRIELGRGVPLEALRGTPLYRAYLGPITTVVRLGLGDVGTSYLPSAPNEAVTSGRVLSGDALAAGVPVIGQTGRVEGTSDVAIVASTDRGSEALVELRPACARLVVRVPIHTIAERAIVSEADEAGTGQLVRAGARLSFRDGARAGVVEHDVRFAREVDPNGDRRCFVHEELELCVERRDLGEDARPSGLLDDPR